MTPDGVQATVSPLGAYDMLYDLAADTGEGRNLSAARPDILAKLKARIAAWDKGNIAPQWTSMRQAVRRQDGVLVKIYD